MKTQNYGLSDYIPLYRPTVLGGAMGEFRPMPTINPYHARQAKENYFLSRANGSRQDNPDWDMPLNGQCSWKKVSKGLYRVLYTPSAEDEEWMDERDANYQNRLEQEGTLQWQEPEVWRQREQEYLRFEARRRAKMTRTAAARIQSSACRDNYGITPKHSFAARAMSAAYKNEPQISFSSLSQPDLIEDQENDQDKHCPCPCSCSLL